MFVEHERTWDEALPAVEYDGLHVAEVRAGVGVADIDSNPEVYRLFAVDQVEEGGSQLGAESMQLDRQFCVMFLTDERHLIDLAAHRIPMSHRLERGHFSILLRPSANLTITHCTTPGDTFHDFHRRPV